MEGLNEVWAELTAAYAVARAIRDEGAPALDRYLTFLAAGGLSQFAYTLLAREDRPMSSIVEAAVSPVRDLSPEESRAFFDAKARELLGISGAELVSRWNAGEYDCSSRRAGPE